MKVWKILLLVKTYIYVRLKILMWTLNKKEVIAFCVHSSGDLQHLKNIFQKVYIENYYKIIILYFYEENHTSDFKNANLILSKNFSKILRFLPLKLVLNTESGVKVKFHLQTRILHLLHSMASVHTVYPEGAFDNYDFLFCAGNYHINEFSKMMAGKQKSYYLIKAGYPVIDYLSEENINKKEIELKKCILFAPSWGQNNCLVLHGYQVIQSLLAKYKVILRPHPMNYVQDEQSITRIIEDFGSNQNFTIDSNKTSFESLLKADLLISDYSGIAIDFAFSKLLPVLYINSTPKVLNQSWNKYSQNQGIQVELRSVIGKIAKNTEPDYLLAEIENMLTLPNVTDIIQARNEYLFNFGESVDSIYESILKISNQDYSNFIKIN